MTRPYCSSLTAGKALLAGFVLMAAACADRADTPADSQNSGSVQFGASGENLSTGEPSLGAALESSLTVRAISDKNNILTGGSDTATITALITDTGNRAVASMPVEFSSSGGVLQDIIGETDANGEATAVLAMARDFRNQDVVVTVISDNSEGVVTVSAAGSELSVAGPSSLVLGDVADLTVTLSAGNGEPIANEEVTFTSAAGNTITPESAVTDSAGAVLVSVDSAAGTDTLTASALEGTVVTAHAIKVASDLLHFTTPSDTLELAVGEEHTISVAWESNNAPVVGEALRFGTTAGQITSDSVVITGADGAASITVSSTSAGPATVSVAADETGEPATQLEIEFIATTPAALNLSMSATRVPTGESSVITALVTDANGNPVKNQEVRFTSADLKGGQLNPAAAVSDSSGSASVTFTAGRQATTFEAVQIMAEVLGSGISDNSALTVVERVLNVTIGTTDLIRSINGDTQYSLPFVVQVADGGGSPLENANVELSIRPVSYSKGYLRQVDSSGRLPGEVPPTENFAADHWSARDEYIIGCGAEDLNGNRILDTGEDNNNNGSLDPQDPAVVAADSVNAPTIESGSISTDATGSGFFAVIYPQSNAGWSTIEITARAKALGAEAEATFVSGLPVEAAELDDVDSAPPNASSPYGTDFSTCTNEN